MKFLNLQLRKLGEVKTGLIILVAGAVLGFVFAKLFKGLYWSNINLLDVVYLNKIKTATIEYSVLFEYVLWNIFQPFILFWIVCVTSLGLPYMALCIVYGGFQTGFFITVIFMRYGLKGILLLLGYTFPHYLIYIPVAMLCLRSGYWLNRGIHYDNNINRKNRTDKILKYLIIIIVLSLLLLLGGLLETYVSSFFLKKILTLF